MIQSTITATPEQVERKWNELTEWQKKQVSLARAMGKALNVTVLQWGQGSQILYDVSVRE